MIEKERKEEMRGKERRGEEMGTFSADVDETEPLRLHEFQANVQILNALKFRVGFGRAWELLACGETQQRHQTHKLRTKERTERG
jgi:hypothetical protein